MKKTLPLLLLFLCTIFITGQTAYALDLATAKEKGLVGETSIGYLAPVNPANKQAVELAKSINAKRKAKYEKIAAKNGISLEQVEKLAGKKALQKTPAGQYIKLGGAWKKK